MVELEVTQNKATQVNDTENDRENPEALMQVYVEVIENEGLKEGTRHESSDHDNGKNLQHVQPKRLENNVIIYDKIESKPLAKRVKELMGTELKSQKSQKHVLTAEQSNEVGHFTVQVALKIECKFSFSQTAIPLTGLGKEECYKLKGGRAFIAACVKKKTTISLKTQTSIYGEPCAASKTSIQQADFKRSGNAVTKYEEKSQSQNGDQNFIVKPHVEEIPGGPTDEMNITKTHLGDTLGTLLKVFGWILFILIFLNYVMLAGCSLVKKDTLEKVTDCLNRTGWEHCEQPYVLMCMPDENQNDLWKFCAKEEQISGNHCPEINNGSIVQPNDKTNCSQDIKCPFLYNASNILADVCYTTKKSTKTTTLDPMIMENTALDPGEPLNGKLVAVICGSLGGVLGLVFLLAVGIRCWKKKLYCIRQCSNDQVPKDTDETHRLTDQSQQNGNGNNMANGTGVIQTGLVRGQVKKIEERIEIEAEPRHK